MQCLYDSGDSYKVQNTDDGAVNAIAVGEDCICAGIGDEFAYTANGRNITFAASGAIGIIGGAYARANSAVTLELDKGNSIYVVLRIDRSRPNGDRLIYEKVQASGVKTENLAAAADAVRDMVLYIFNVGDNGITSVQDKRNIRHIGTGGDNITVGTLSAGRTSITLYNEKIKSNSILSIYTSIYGVNPKKGSVRVSNGSVAMNFEAQSTNMQVGVKIEGEY